LNDHKVSLLISIKFLVTIYNTGSKFFSPSWCWQKIITVNNIEWNVGMKQKEWKDESW